MYSAVAALICSTMSHLDKVSISLDPYHRELMSEESGSLVQRGSKERWKRQQVYGAKCTKNQSWKHFARDFCAFTYTFIDT